MKKTGNRPITEADTDFSKLQKNEIKNKIKSEKILENFRDFFPPFFYYFLIFFLTKKYVITFSTS